MPLRSPLSRLWLGIFFALLCSTASAQQADAGVRDSLLQVATVVGTRSADRNLAAPRYALQLSALSQQGAQTIADALRRLPGANLRDYGGAGGLKTVSIRGMGASHTAVSLDGMPVSDAQSGQIDFRRFGLVQLEQMTLAVADQPLLLSPPRSLAAAHIALISPIDQRRIGLQIGSFGETMAHAQWSGSRGAHQLSAYADAQQGENDYPFTLRNHSLVTQERRTHSRLSSGNAQLNYTFAPSAQTRLAAQTAFYHNEQQLPGMVIYYTSPGTEDLRQQQVFGQIALHHRRGHHTLMGGAKWAWQTSRYRNYDGQYPGGLLLQNYTQREAYATIGWAYEPSPQWGVAYAADLTRETLHSNLSTDHDVARTTLLQALSARYVWRNWTLTARGLAHLSWNAIDAASPASSATNQQRIVPSLTLARRIDLVPHASLLWRGYYKAHFRLPTFTESYYYRLGSRQLRPETTHQLGTGLVARFNTKRWPSAQLAVDFYHNRVSDRISAIPYNIYIWRMTNLGIVDTWGLDAHLQSRLRLSRRQWLDIDGSYAWQHVTDTSDPEATSYGRQLAYTPRHTASLGATWTHPWLTLGLSAMAAGERWSNNEHLDGTRLPPYVELQAAIERRIEWRRRHRIDLRLSATNLTNHQYEIVRFYPMPGRAWHASITYHY